MRYGILAIIAAALCLIGQTALANPAQQPPPDQEMPAPHPSIGDDELATFADIYVGIQALEQELTQRVAEAESAEAAQQLHASTDERMIGLIREHGWTVEQYNSIAEAINTTPELRMQAIALINARS